MDQETMILRSWEASAAIDVLSALPEAAIFWRRNSTTSLRITGICRGADDAELYPAGTGFDDLQLDVVPNENRLARPPLDYEHVASTDARSCSRWAAEYPLSN